ncbi:MarR family transcriptional regulator [Sphingobium sp. SYK-6]|uniref:MarR family winged helix-turn-helix transcriptional regulator n=1 Tax=Sphingobium sp. (strain NBRC 103272 / SYK-6) TaxID=627192 RepID=UPI00022773C9|nr:MarR family winged helix-turn-helix transcriptional regulator [Sphingobium sp. SYK-6]BAK66539.1 MarR family transcriptional regulator [Sphingobium sp. SYK-6]
MRIDLLKDMPGHLIRRVQQISSAYFARELAEFELTSVQFVALVALAETPGLDQTRLAELIDFDKATIGGVIERLIRKGLITRTVSSQDRRVKRLAVTPAGMALIKVGFPGVQRVQNLLTTALSDEEARQFSNLLKKIIASFDE